MPVLVWISFILSATVTFSAAAVFGFLNIYALGYIPVSAAVLILIWAAATFFAAQLICQAWQQHSGVSDGS